MSRFDQAKMLMRVKKIQKELQKQIITVEQGDGAVKVEITGEQKPVTHSRGTNVGRSRRAPRSSAMAISRTISNRASP